jgi:hypothetical protein
VQVWISVRSCASSRHDCFEERPEATERPRSACWSFFDQRAGRTCPLYTTGRECASLAAELLFQRPRRAVELFVGLLRGGAYKGETVAGFGDEKAPEVYGSGFGHFRFRMMPG